MLLRPPHGKSDMYQTPKAVLVLIYVIGPEGGPYKVGLTSDIQRRLDALQTASPVDLQVHHTFEVADVYEARVAERAAHERLASHRVRGEWFDCSLQSVVAAISKPNIVCVGALAEAGSVLDHDRREAKDFYSWFRFHGLSVKRASSLLGCSPNAIQSWKKSPPPRYVLMACYALTMGLDPVA